VFEDLSEFVQDSLVLTIKGKQYEVPPVDALTGAKVVRKWNLGQAIGAGVTLSDDEIAELQDDAASELDVYKMVLGSAYDRMVADGLGYLMIQRAGKTALALIVSGAEAAEEQWTIRSLAGQGKVLTTDPTPTISTTTESSSNGSTSIPSIAAPESSGPESSATGMP
jgi:hypothetical protein